MKNKGSPWGKAAWGGDPPVTKSCLNHRLRKLLALSQTGEGERGAQQ
ncbi:helix-turn-helix domain-containing protein [uncultured Pseudoflavonifractor sp.]|nr:helix-turn-helix domain-containing protein [uncultured Pseudoflavonifractor sp.]